MMRYINKKILVVGAGTSQVNPIIHASNLGYEVYTVDQNPSAPGFQYSKDYKSGDIKNSNFLISVAKDFQVDGITSFSTDVPVISIAEASFELGLSSISIDQAKLSVNKYEQREMLARLGVPTPKFRTFKSISEGMKAINEVGYKSVIKPIDASGSRGVRLSNKDSEINKEYLKEALEISSTNTGLIESFIEGPEVAVDGFVQDGKVIILSVCDKKRSNPPSLLDVELTFPAALIFTDLEQVKSLAKKVMKATNIQNSPFHMEIIIAKNGPILVEFAARGAGFNVFDIILPHVSGIDTVHSQIKQCLGQRPVFNELILKAAHLVFISSDIDGVIKRIHGEEKIKEIADITKYRLFFKEGDSVKKLSSGSDRLGYLLSLTEDLSSCRKAIDLAKEYLKLEIH